MEVIPNFFGSKTEIKNAQLQPQSHQYNLITLAVAVWSQVKYSKIFLLEFLLNI